MERRPFHLLGILVLALALAPAMAYASDYEVTVSRQGSNLYSVNEQQVLIRTQNCYEYGYGTDAVLHVDGYLGAFGTVGSLIFTDDNTTCGVAGVYTPSYESAGEYSVSVSEEGDNWYGIEGTSLYIQTSLCVSYVYDENAVLKLNGFGSGTLYFLEDNSSCNVSGIYSVAQL